MFLKYQGYRKGKSYHCLASLGVFVRLLSVTYASMLLSASEQIHSKDATPTAPKF